MTEDRRTSLRRRDNLPLAWRPCEAEPTLQEVCNALGLPAAAVSGERLTELEGEVTRALRGLRDPAVADALALLNRRISLLQEAMLGSLAVPPAEQVDLSADGLGFSAPVPLSPGSWLGIHLVLPEGTHVICAGRVSHCQPEAEQHAIGVELKHLDEATARRLTRYVIAYRG